MSLQSLINSASSGSTITLSSATVDSTTVVIDKPLTIIGRSSPSSGSRVGVTINTGGDATALRINASNVVLRGLDIDHAYSTLGAGGVGTAISIEAGGVYSYPDGGSLVNENIDIDDCKIHYGKFGVSSKAKEFTVKNSELYNKEVSSTTGRAIAVYSNDGVIEVMDNTYTTAGNVKIEGIHFNFATNDGFVNKRNGSVYYSGNSNNFASTRKWVFFEVGSEKGLSGDSMELYVTGNSIQSASSAFVVMQANSADSFSHFSKIVVADNTVPSTFSNGVYQIDGSYTSKPVFNDFAVTPLAFVYGNTTQTGISTDGKIVLGNVITFRGYNSYPSNINDFASFSAPAPPADPTVQTINDLASGNTADITVSTLIGGGSNSVPVAMKKFGKTVSNAEANRVFNNGSTSSTVRLVLSNSDSIPYDKALSVFPNTWRTTTNGYSSPIAFSIKFVDSSNLGSFVSSPGTQNYKLHAPEIANRTHLKIYKENADGTATYVTNATRVTGESFIYSFTLTSNSVYTAADSGEMFVSSGAGSDPHITTIHGTHWVMPKIRGRNRDLTLLADNQMEIKAHVHGYPNGDFFSHANVVEGKSNILSVDFQKKKLVLGNSNKVKILKTDSKSLENGSSSNKNQTTVFVDGFNDGGVFLHIDYNQRYISPIFNRQITNKTLRGMLMGKN